MSDAQQPRRLRFRLRTLLIGIALLALLLVNYIQWVRLPEQRARAEANVAEAMRFRQVTEAANQQARAARATVERSSAQAAQPVAQPNAAPTQAGPGPKKP